MSKIELVFLIFPFRKPQQKLNQDIQNLQNRPQPSLTVTQHSEPCQEINDPYQDGRDTRSQGSRNSKMSRASGKNKKRMTKEDSNLHLLSFEERQMLNPKYHSGEKTFSQGRGSGLGEKRRSRNSRDNESRSSSIRNFAKSSAVSRTQNLMQTTQAEWENSTDNNRNLYGTGNFPSITNSKAQSSREVLKLQAQELKIHTQGLLREARRSSQKSLSARRPTNSQSKAALLPDPAPQVKIIDQMPFSGRTNLSQTRGSRSGSKSIHSPCPLRSRGDSLTKMYKFKNEKDPLSPSTRPPSSTMPPMHTRTFKVPKPNTSAYETAKDIANQRLRQTSKSREVPVKLKRQSSACNLRAKSKTAVLDLGFPKIEDISYFNLKHQSPKYHQHCDKETDNKSKAFLEMQRKIAKLESQKASQARKIKKLQQMLASQDGQGECCCDELRCIHQEKERNLAQIAETWKEKAYVLASEYQQRVEGVRQENQILRGKTYESIEKMRQYQDQVIQDILRKQEDMVLSYDSKLRKREKENRELQKRLVQHRNAMKHTN